MSLWFLTCKNRRSSRGGPLEMGRCWLEDWRHETRPLLPEMTFEPEISISRHHESGFFCQSTKPPDCSLLLVWTDSSPWWNSDALILTCPTTHMLLTAFSAAWPPIAAMYCCTMYLAVDASCMHARTYREIKHHVRFIHSFCSEKRRRNGGGRRGRRGGNVRTMEACLTARSMERSTWIWKGRMGQPTMLRMKLSSL